MRCSPRTRQGRRGTTEEGLSFEPINYDRALARSFAPGCECRVTLTSRYTAIGIVGATVTRGPKAFGRKLHRPGGLPCLDFPSGRRSSRCCRRPRQWDGTRPSRIHHRRVVGLSCRAASPASEYGYADPPILVAVSAAAHHGLRAAVRGGGAAVRGAAWAKAAWVGGLAIVAVLLFHAVVFGCFAVVEAAASKRRQRKGKPEVP